MEGDWAGRQNGKQPDEFPSTSKRRFLHKVSGWARGSKPTSDKNNQIDQPPPQSAWQRTLWSANQQENTMSYLQEAVAEYAREHGRLDTSRAWIPTPFDTWERNPFYQGPPQPHPEEYGYDDPQ